MGLVDKVFEAVIALFLIFIFAVFVFPSLSEVTGQSVVLPLITLVILAIVIVISVIIAIIKFILG